MLHYRFLYYGEYDRVIEYCTKYSEDTLLAISYEQKGMEEEAFQALLNQGRIRDLSQEEIAALRQAFKESGMKGVRRFQHENQQSPETARPINQAMYYASQGEMDQAFEWLEKAWEFPLWGYEHAPSSRRLDPLRDDPRFEQLLRKQNLPEDVIQRHLAGY
jgi:hypothetical protein